MRYRLRTLLILVGVLPPLLGILIAPSWNPAHLRDSAPVWIGILGWLFVFGRYVWFRPNSCVDEECLLFPQDPTTGSRTDGAE
jgi:hypothetical protein